MKLDVVIYLMLASQYVKSINSTDRSNHRPVLGFNGAKYLLTGQTFNTSCTFSPNCITSESLCDIKLLHIVHCIGSSSCDGVTQNTSITNNTTISLLKSNLMPGDTGTYLCRYNHTYQDSFNLWVVDKPSGPVNISCISQDLEDLRCSWIKSKKDNDSRLLTLYRSYFKCSPMWGQFLCPHPVFSNKQRSDETGCNIASSTSPEDYTFIPSLVYTLFINASNEAGSHLTEHPIHPLEVVKLSPPRVTSMIGSVSVDLTLSLKPDPILSVLIEREHVIYEISYSCRGFHRTVIFNTTGSNSTVSIRDLIPYTSYTFSIRNRIQTSQGERYWSDISTEHCFTLPALPVAVPRIYGYILHRGIISVLIQPILKIDKNAENASYNISIEGGSLPLRFLSASWNTLFIPDITNTRNVDQLVGIKTTNNVGTSRNSNHIVIPGYNKDRPIPNHIIVEESTNVYYVSWNANGNTRNLNKTVVIWCIGIYSHCQSNLNKIQLSPDATDTTIQTVREDKWIFAVYYVYSDGYITEMVFTECQFPSVNQAPRGIADFSVIPHVKSLLVKPGEFCSKKYPSRPLTYTVLYREKTGDNITSCEEDFRTISINATTDIKETMILNLKESTDYNICLSVTTRGGKSVSQPRVSRTLQSSSNRSTLLETVVIVVVLTVVFAAVVIVGLCKLRKRWTEIDTQIDLPKFYITSEGLYDSGFPSSRSSDDTSSTSSGQYDGKSEQWIKNIEFSEMEHNVSITGNLKTSNQSCQEELQGGKKSRTESGVSTSDRSDSYTDVSQTFEDSSGLPTSCSRSYEQNISDPSQKSKGVAEEVHSHILNKEWHAKQNCVSASILNQLTTDTEDKTLSSNSQDRSDISSYTLVS